MIFHAFSKSKHSGDSLRWNILSLLDTSWVLKLLIVLMDIYYPSRSTLQTWSLVLSCLIILWLTLLCSFVRSWHLTKGSLWLIPLDIVSWLVFSPISPSRNPTLPMWYILLASLFRLPLSSITLPFSLSYIFEAPLPNLFSFHFRLLYNVECILVLTGLDTSLVGALLHDFSFFLGILSFLYESRTRTWSPSLALKKNIESSPLLHLRWSGLLIDMGI